MLFVPRCGINTLDISKIISMSFESRAMPRFNRQQMDQSIGRRQVGQAASVIANNFNCSIRTIKRLRQRLNATNSTDDDQVAVDHKLQHQDRTGLYCASF